MRKLVIILSFIFILSVAAQAKILNSLEPKDKTTTSGQIQKVTGYGDNLDGISANGVPIGTNGKAFEFGVILSYGKNMVKVEVKNKEGKSEAYTRRLLNLAYFPDLEVLYNGRPHWAKYKAITLATLQIAEGYPDGNFYLEKNITRGEFATWVAKAKGVVPQQPQTDPFTDVPKEHWRAPYIKEVTDKKYMKGLPDGSFGIDETISRAEAAKISLNIEGSTFEKELNSFFFDVQKTNPYYSDIKTAKAKGLIKGTSWKDKLYEPERALTRGEAAVLIGRFGRVKWLERWLYNMSIGFDYPSRINTAPVISSLVLEPNTISLSSSKKTAILKAEVSEAQGYEDIINVKANISDFSGPPDAEMYSPKKENGIYLLQFEGSAESTGEKSIKVTATDKYGWKNEKEIKVLVVK